jgi:katanin p80 WD40 repeat-containing subunit B1
LKLWDLEQQKVVRTFTTGHRSKVTCVDFHPYGDFFASGSLDTNVKVWDIRRKACLQTYRGHLQGIKTAKFTPDGRWLVSGGEDGIVKVI